MESQETTVKLSALPDQPIYNVKAVCLRTGIPAATLRAWERRYGLPTPDRSQKGYRLYSERDVAILHWLIHQTSNGISIRHAERQLRQHLDSGTELAIHIPARGWRSIESSPRSPALVTQDIVDALLTMDERRADELVTEALALFTPETVLTTILGAVINAIREDVQQGNATALIEHSAFNLIRRRLILYTQATTASSKSGRPVLLVSLPEGRSELELLMLTALLRRSGFPVATMSKLGSMEGSTDEVNPSELESITIEALGINAKAVIFYTASAESAARLSNIHPLRDHNGSFIRLMCCGEGAELLEEHQQNPHIEYFNADLKTAVRVLRSSWRSRHEMLKTAPFPLNAQTE